MCGKRGLTSDTLKETLRPPQPKILAGSLIVLLFSHRPFTFLTLGVNDKLRETQLINMLDLQHRYFIHSD